MSNSKTFVQNVIKGIRHNLKKYLHNKYSEVNINWLYLKYLKHLPPGKIHSHNLFKKKTWFYDPLEYLHGITEIFIDEVYKQKLPPNALIIDCGAHIGLSLIYLKRLCPTANIIAFEPDPQNFSLLKKNIESHGFSSVELKNEAVWTTNATLSFIADGNMSSKIGLSQGAIVQVRAVRLADFLTRKVDFLKIDIEGAEYEVIKDIQDKLPLVENLFIEYHGSFKQNNELIEILQIVTKNGFNYYIKEATAVYEHPFFRTDTNKCYDIQLNIFCFKNWGND